MRAARGIAAPAGGGRGRLPRPHRRRRVRRRSPSSDRCPRAPSCSRVGCAARSTATSRSTAIRSSSTCQHRDRDLSPRRCDAQSLFANADAALYRAKQKAAEPPAFSPPPWTSSCATGARWSAICAGDRATANCSWNISRSGTATATIIGFEALVRWHHPLRGSFRPADFIPIAEESGLIIEIGEWVLREACREAACWAECAAGGGQRSAIQFRRGNLQQMVTTILRETGLAPARLELEITEGVLIENVSRAAAILKGLKGARRPHRARRFRHRLFVAVLSAIVSARPHQDRPLLHRKPRPQRSLAGDRTRRHRPRSRPGAAGARGRRRDRRAACDAGRAKDATKCRAI